MKNEIILYRPNDTVKHIEVRFENETVWLSINQIASLFNRDKSVISRHLRNIFNEGELTEEATVAKNATVQIESGRKVKRKIEYYNLDAIISVGYRVNSKQGTQFRIWATTVIRDYLLKGYALNQRIDKIENNFENLSKEVAKISLQIKTNELPTQGIFFDGQIFDAYVFANDIIKSAKNSIMLIDNYVDDTTLMMLSKRNPKCKTIVYTQKISPQLQLDLDKHNCQYPPISIKQYQSTHDRFLIIDEKDLYHIGASLKDLGKKWFAFSKLNSFLPEVLGKLEIND